MMDISLFFTCVLVGAASGLAAAAAADTFFAWKDGKDD